MKKFYCFTVKLLCSIASFAMYTVATYGQIDDTKTAIGSFDIVSSEEYEEGRLDIIGDGKVFGVVEQMPEFPGGQTALMEYLSKNVKYPVVAQENGVQGRVVVSFIVERDGSINEVEGQWIPISTARPCAW